MELALIHDGDLDIATDYCDYNQKLLPYIVINHIDQLLYSMDHMTACNVQKFISYTYTTYSFSGPKNNFSYSGKSPQSYSIGDEDNWTGLVPNVDTENMPGY